VQAFSKKMFSASISQTRTLRSYIGVLIVNSSTSGAPDTASPRICVSRFLNVVAQRVRRTHKSSRLCRQWFLQAAPAGRCYSLGLVLQSLTLRNHVGVSGHTDSLALLPLALIPPVPGATLT
jgi:hypothetical protein